MARRKYLKAANVVNNLAEGCRHLDPVGGERHILDATLIYTEARVAELWSSCKEGPTARYCTHPFADSELEHLTAWVSAWAGEEVQGAIREAQDWLKSFDDRPLPTLELELPTTGVARGRGYLWGEPGESERVDRLVRVSCSPGLARRRVFWLQCEASGVKRLVRRAERLAVELGKKEPVGCRSRRSPPSPSDDALKNALTTLRRGLQDNLQEELPETADPLFSVLFLKRVGDVLKLAGDETPGMSFRFDSEQTEQLVSLTQGERTPATGRNSPPNWDWGTLPVTGDGLVGLLEEVRYEKQFAGRVMWTCSAAKFEGWKNLPEPQFPRDVERTDPRLQSARKVLGEVFLKENLYQIPLLFEDGGSTAPRRLADLIVVIATETTLTDDTWLRAQFVVRKHARFLQLASQLDTLRDEARLASSRLTAHGQLTRTQQASAHLHALSDSENWAERGPQLAQILRNIDADMRRWLGRPNAAPRTLAEVVRLAWDRQAGIRIGYIVLCGGCGPRGAVPTPGELGWALVSALECAFNNALTASGAVGDREAEAVRDELRQFPEGVEIAAALFDTVPATHPAVAVLPDPAVAGVRVLNLCPRGHRGPVVLPHGHGLALSGVQLRQFGWDLQCSEVVPGLWCTRVFLVGPSHEPTN